MKNQKGTNQDNSFSNDIKDFFALVKSNWYLFFISVTVALCVAVAYLRYKVAVYNVRSTILIDSDGSHSFSANDLMEGLGLFSGKVNLNNEIGVIKSHSMVKKTLQQLDFDVSYYIEGNVRKREVYHTLPIMAKFDTLFPNPKNTPFFIKIVSDSTFRLSVSSNIDSGIEGAKPGLAFDSVVRFNYPCKTKFFNLTVFRSGEFERLNSSDEIFFVLNDISRLTESYVARLGVEPAYKNSSILELTSSGTITEKEIAFLNKLGEVYIQNDLEAKNRIARNTLNFIDSQLMSISDSLGDAEGRLERFRSTEKLMNLGATVDNSFNQLNDLEQERAILIVKDKYYRYLLQYLNSNSALDKLVAPSAMGISDPLLNNLINELYKLNSDRLALQFSAQDKNPSFELIEMKIFNTKKALIENVENIINGSNISLQDNQSRINKITNVIDKLPGNERYLFNIERKFNLNDHIYNFLLEKRTEVGISKAAISTDIRIIDQAQLDPHNPGKPNRQMAYFVALFLGIIAPIGFIYIRNMLNDTVVSKNQLEKLSHVPILGLVGHDNGKKKFSVLESPKSFVAESLRSIRTNLKYLTYKNHGSKVIGVTSSVGGEGKTFFSFNMASTIASSGVKVLLIGADLRKPRLASHLELDSSEGLTNYLVGDTDFKNFIKQTNIKGLDVLFSGPIPPNPSELLTSEKFGELIGVLKKEYDYVIIDTPPLGLVSDYYLVSQYTDASLFLVRCAYTKVHLLKELNSIYDSGKLQNVYIVFNDVKNLYGNYGYGYGYGYSYGYYDDSIKSGNWLKNIWNRIKD